MRFYIYLSIPGDPGEDQVFSIYSACDNKSNMISFAARMKKVQHALKLLNNTKNVNGKE